MQTKGSNARHRSIAKMLSTDRPYEDLYPHQVLPDIGASFIIYANGTRWILECWVNWRLYWMPESRNINSFSKHDLQYDCTWLSEKRHISNVKMIIWKHPNCTRWQLRSFPIWLIKLIRRYN